MTLAKKLLRSGSGMAGAHAAVILLTFARNIMLARLLGPEQFGIAATYAVAMGFLEASFEFGPDKYLLQAPDGARVEVLGAAHTFTAGRGIFAGLVLFLVAEPIAALFHVPELAWAYQVLAIAPIVKGFIHFDFRRRQRELVYRQEIAITLASTAAGFAAALAVAALERSHVAMLTSVLVQVAVMVGLSFAVAKIPYRLSAARPQLAALFQFGWPLVLNSLIIVAATQGDRALVGAAFGPETLAQYATAAILAGAPSLIVMGVIGMMMLPVLGPLQGQPLFRARYKSFGVIIALAVLALAAPVALLGPFAIPLVFGAAYRPEPLLVAALAATGGVSMLRAWTNVAALAVGNSKATLYTNCVRISGLVLAGLCILAGSGLTAVALALLAGELAALAFGLLRTHRINGLPVTTGLSFLAPTLAALFVSILLAGEVSGHDWRVAVLVTIAIQTTAFLALLALSPPTRGVLRNTFAALRT